MRLRRATALAAALALGLSGIAAAATITGSSGGMTATMHVGTHHPTVGRRWPLTFTASRGGRADRATVTYEYLYNGQVVAVRAHHTFTGHFSDALVFPADAVGHALTFRAAIKDAHASVNLDYAISVVR
jgi:hypothetical protein